VLVLFAGGVVALLIVAALAFDVGMMLLERRDAQDAVDAAALGAARYVFDADCTASGGWVCTEARAAALRIAALNGYDSSEPDETVQVFIPPVTGRYVGLPNFIEVQIDSSRPSIFGGVIGQAVWPVGVFAVATNHQNVSYSFSMLALNPTKCYAIRVQGSGSVVANGNISSNSNGADCPGDDIGFFVSGQASVDVLADDATCRSAGDIVRTGGGTITCTLDANSFILPDPLRNEPPPDQPPLPAGVVRVYSPPGFPVADDPSGCPGGTSAATESAPARCNLDFGKTKGSRWVLFPGLYPGGVRIAGDTVAYLVPGTYWIGGGGITATNGSVISVGSLADAQADTAACPNPLPGQVDSAGCLWPHYDDACLAASPPTCPIEKGGILIYNSELPTSAGGAINLGGGEAALLITAPMDDPYAIIDDIIIWQDKAVCIGMSINGNSSYVEVGGLIYEPCGPSDSASGVTVNGNGGQIILDQVIADSFKINGNGGNITALNRTNLDAELVAAGLVD